MNENDYKVVTFKNISDIDFTPVLGAMFDSKPIFGKTKEGCIAAGEELYFPYHVGKRLAINLAKHILLKRMPLPEVGKGDPSQLGSSASITDEKIDEIVSKILVGEYAEEKPMKETETELMMKKFEELNKTVEALKGTKVASEGYQDKKEVIEELERRGIEHDKRKSKDILEALLKD